MSALCRSLPVIKKQTIETEVTFVLCFLFSVEMNKSGLLAAKFCKVSLLNSQYLNIQIFKQSFSIFIFISNMDTNRVGET